MYDSSAIAALTGRIGWAPLMLPTSKVLSSDNEGSTGRLFSAYHAMCIVENVEECMPVSNAITASESITDDVLNDYLKQLTDQAILKVLSRVFDNNDAANYRINSEGCRIDLSGTDYTAKIVARAAIFDDAVGYQVAYNVLEMLMNTSRSNLRERSIQDRMALISQLQGARDERGVVIVDGIFQKLEDAFKRINAALFPQVTPGPKLRNKSYLW